MKQQNQKGSHFPAAQLQLREISDSEKKAWSPGGQWGQTRVEPLHFLSLQMYLSCFLYQCLSSLGFLKPSMNMPQMF